MIKNFRTYDAAIAFAAKSGMLPASKPFRRLIWIDGVQVAIWGVNVPASIVQGGKKVPLAH